MAQLIFGCLSPNCSVLPWKRAWVNPFRLSPTFIQSACDKAARVSTPLINRPLTPATRPSHARSVLLPFCSPWRAHAILGRSQRRWHDRKKKKHAFIQESKVSRTTSELCFCQMRLLVLGILPTLSRRGHETLQHSLFGWCDSRTAHCRRVLYGRDPVP